MMDSLFGDYPEIHSEYTILHRHVFDTNLPGRPKREGDAILVMGGAEFLDKLSHYPETLYSM